MAPLVQSACPGCKHILRIPAEWLHQPIRCKHCGTVMHAKQRTTAAAVATVPPAAPANRTPVPATRTAHVTPAVAPMAFPAAQAFGGSPFDELDPTEEDSTPRRGRRRRKNGSWWKGPALSLAVFVIAGIVTIANWDRIKTQISSAISNEEPLAENDKNKNPLAAPSAKKLHGKKSSTNGSTPVKGNPKNNERSHNPKANPRMTGQPFPRRALLISVHDYLYANPIHDGMRTSPSDHNLNSFIEQLNRGFRIPLNQIAHLSDEAGGKWRPRAPTKAIIEKTLTSFLDSSRAQDRIMVFFIGHAVELDDGVYLAPIEGELDKSGTLIPLKWVYDKLAACKARQKVFVLDGNRYSPTFGQERPGGGEMGEKLDAALKAPPAGVQVWSACVAKQKSYETDDSPMGVFLDEVFDTIGEVMQHGLLGKIQKADDPLPVEKYVEWVNERMKKEMDKRKLQQTSRLSGKEADAGLAYEKSEAPPPDAVACLAPAPTDAAENKALIVSVLDDIGTPSVKVTHDMALRYDALPSFSADKIKKYEGDKPNADSPLRKAVKSARATLWAIYPGAVPKDASAEVEPIRARVKYKLDILRDGYRAPAGGAGEKKFKENLTNDERAVAKIMNAIRDALEGLEAKEVVEAKDNESKRWQVNYDFMLARVQMEYAYLYEYQSMLGSMRKEYPPRDAELHGGWKLASTSNLQGDSAGKKLASKARKTLDKIADKHAGTPWEVLAKREKLTNLGLEWQAAK